MMRSIFNSKFVLSWVLVTASLGFGRSVQANESIVSGSDTIPLMDRKLKESHWDIDSPERVGLTNIGKLKNLNASQSIPEPVQNPKSAQEATSKDILASPLSASRIHPEVGVFR